MNFLHNTDRAAELVTASGLEWSSESALDTGSGAGLGPEHAEAQEAAALLDGAPASPCSLSDCFSFSR